MNATNLSKDEKEILSAYRHLPLAARARLRQEIDKIVADLEEKEDAKAIKERRDEPTISAEEVYRQLGV